MLIDWFTVAAQALNFVVLVWLMKHYLYGPILIAIDAREKKIATDLAAAAGERSTAEKARVDLDQKNTAFDAGRTALLAKVTLEAETDRARLLDGARRDAQDQTAAARAALQAEARTMIKQVTTLAEAEVYASVSQAFNDLVSVRLQERLVNVLIERMREMPSGARQKFGDALTSSGGTPTVRSGFELSAEQRNDLERAVKELFAADIHWIFAVAPRPDFGIELTAGGERLAWGIEEYLKGLQEHTATLLAGMSTAATQAAVASASSVAPSAHAQAS